MGGAAVRPGDRRAERSIDRIESVLNRDRKVATYKLALFRALAEIGMTRYNQVRWVSLGAMSPLEYRRSLNLAA